MDKQLFILPEITIPFKADHPPDEEDIVVAGQLVKELQDMIVQFQKDVVTWSTKYGCKAEVIITVDHIEVL